MVYPFAQIYLGWPVRFFISKIEGKSNFPKGPFIFAANHASYLDDIAVPLMTTMYVKKPFHIFVNSRYYKSFLARTFCNHFQCIPVDVSKDVADEEARKKTNDKAHALAIEYLKKGELFGIFPEGGRSPDGTIQKAKIGVAKIALEANVPVVPIGIKGSYDILPKGAALPKFSKRMSVHIGTPLYFSEDAGKTDQATYRKVTDTIMQKIGELIK